MALDVESRLRSLRESRGWSQYRLSKESGVAASAINKIESGDMRPTVDVLSRLCSALGITLSEFFAEDRSDELPPDLRRLISIAKELTPQQREQLAKFLETMKGGDD